MEERYMVLGSLRASPNENEDSTLYPDLMEVPSIIPEDIDSEQVYSSPLVLDETMTKLNLEQQDYDPQESLNSSMNPMNPTNRKRSKSNSVFRSVPAEPLLQGTRLEFSPRRSLVISDTDVNAPILELSAPIMPVIDSQIGFVAAGLVRSKSKLAISKEVEVEEVEEESSPF